MKRILVVDDSPTIRRMMIASLRALSGEVVFDEAKNGLEAIERLALAPVSVLFLDLNMPDIHGLEVIEFVRGHQAYSEIPICVVTTRGDAESQTQALNAGANVYLTKPFTPQDIITQANKLLAVAD